MNQQEIIRLFALEFDMMDGNNILDIDTLHYDYTPARLLKKFESLAIYLEVAMQLEHARGEKSGLEQGKKFVEEYINEIKGIK